MVLARCVPEVGKDGVPSALRRYEDLRRERVAWIVRRSRALGRVGQLENPILCRLRDVALRAVPDRIQLRQFERVMLYKKGPLFDDCGVGPSDAPGGVEKVAGR